MFSVDQFVDCSRVLIYVYGFDVQGAKVPLNEYEFPPNKIANVQSQLVRPFHLPSVHVGVGRVSVLVNSRFFFIIFSLELHICK